jgi:serine/threonine protein kinase
MGTRVYAAMDVKTRMILIFDMLHQLLEPIQRLQAGYYVHGDIKPANICIKYNENMRNKYEFTLIDFGIMTKFKLNKVQNRYSQPIGNLLFNSLRGLMCEQTRFQDDYESLIFLAYSFIFDNVPWQTDKAIYKNQA